MCVCFEKNTGEWVSEFVSPAAVSFFFLFFVTSLSFEKILKLSSRDDKKNCVFVTIFASAVKKHVHNNHDNDNDDNTN